MAENNTVETFEGILKDVSIKESSKGKKYLSLSFENEEGKDVYMNSFSDKDLELEYKLKTGVLYKVEYYTDKGGYKKFLSATMMEGQHRLDDFQKRAKEGAKEPDRKEKQIIRMSALKASLDYYKILSHTGDPGVLEMVKNLTPREVEETALEYERFIREVLE